MEDNQQRNGAAFAAAFFAVVRAASPLSMEFAELWASAEQTLRSLWNGVYDQKGKCITLKVAMDFFKVDTPSVAHGLVVASQGMALPQGQGKFSDAELALATHRFATNNGSMMVLEDLCREGRVWLDKGKKGKCPQRAHVVGGKEISLTAITTRDQFVARVEQLLRIARAEARVMEQFQQEQDALVRYEADKATALATGAPLPPAPKAIVKAAPAANDDETVRRAHESLYKRLMHNGTLKAETLEALIGFLTMCRNTTVEATSAPTVPSTITDDLTVVA